MRLRRRQGADSEHSEGADRVDDEEMRAAVEESPAQEEEPATVPGGRRTRRQPLRARAAHQRTVESGDGHDSAASAEQSHSEAGEADPGNAEAAQEERRSPDPRSDRGPSTKSWVRGLFDEQVTASREQAEREAALELRQFMTPAMEQLLLNVPGSSSPEEAGAILDRQSALELQKPVEVSPSSVVDLSNPPEMKAYPPAEKLSNRVLRLANRHWAKAKPRPSSEVVAEKTAIAEQEFARKPAGTQRCYAFHGTQRCRGVFVFNADERSSGELMRCPTCMAPHVWDESLQEWMVIDDAPAVTRAPARGAVSAGS